MASFAKPACPESFLPAVTMESTNDNQLSAVLIALMKGVLYADEAPLLWQRLLNLQAQVRDYVRILGLELQLFEDEGYAYVQNQNLENLESSDNQPALPRLIPKRPLSYPVSLLLALLRRKLAEHDAGSGDARLIVHRDDIVDLIKTFLPGGANEARQTDQIDAYISKVVELGFARRLRNEPDKIEIRRIIKAFVDAQWLHDFDQRLQAYLKTDLNDGMAE